MTVAVGPGAGAEQRAVGPRAGPARRQVAAVAVGPGVGAEQQRAAPGHAGRAAPARAAPVRRTPAEEAPEPVFEGALEGEQDVQPLWERRCGVIVAEGSGVAAAGGEGAGGAGREQPDAEDGVVEVTERPEHLFGPGPPDPNYRRFEGGTQQWGNGEGGV